MSVDEVDMWQRICVASTLDSSWTTRQGDLFYDECRKVCLSWVYNFVWDYSYAMHRYATSQTIFIQRHCSCYSSLVQFLERKQRIKPSETLHSLWSEIAGHFVKIVTPATSCDPCLKMVQTFSLRAYHCLNFRIYLCLSRSKSNNFATKLGVL